MLITKQNIGLVIAGFLLTIGVVMVGSRFSILTTASNKPKPFLFEGYDFNLKRFLNDGEQTVSQIQINGLRTVAGAKLYDQLHGDLLLLAVVDPACEACQLSTDMIRNIHEKTDQLGMDYLPLVLSSLKDDDLKRYAQTLGFQTAATWTNGVPVPALLNGMGTPTHILVTREGVILGTWTGTSVERETRTRMTNQISADLFLIAHVVKSLRHPEQHTVVSTSPTW